MKNRNVFQRFAILLSITLLVALQVLSFAPQQVKAAFLSKGVTISAVDEAGNSVLPMTAVEISDGDTALDVLKEASEKKNVQVDIIEDPNWGAYINNIGQVTIPENAYWGFSINGESAPVGVSSYEAENGDSFLFKVTNYPPETVSATVTAVHRNGQLVIDEQVEIIKGSSTYDALKLAAKQAKVSVDVSIDSQWFAFINTLNGIELTDNEWWSASLNEESMQTGLSTPVVNDGDHLQLALPQVTEEEPVDETPSEGDTNESDPPNETDKEETVTEEKFNKETLNNAVTSASQYVSNNDIGDWQAIALKKAGKNIPSSYLTSLKKQVSDSQGSFARITDYERLTLGILAAGQDPTNFEGYNLVESIYNGNVTKQGLNGVAYALIALDSANFEVPASAKWNREALVNEILSSQNQDGGWSWSGDTKSDSDTTAMVLTALAPYVDSNAAVQSSVDQAVAYLSTQFKNVTIDNSSTAAQIVIALSALSIDSHSLSFTNDDGSLIEYLLSFQNNDGGFDWQGGETSDSFSTDQGYRGIVAYQLFLNGKGSLYTFELVEEENKETPTEEDHSKDPVTDDMNNDKQKDSNDQSTSEEESTEDSKDNTTNNASQQEQINEGHRLPDTATSNYNMLIFGSIMIGVGSVYLFTRKKQQVNKA